MFLLLQFIDFKARSRYKFLRFLSGSVSLPMQCHVRSSLTKIFLRLQRRLDLWQGIVKRTCWSDYVSHIDISLSFLSSRKKMVTLPMCWSFFIIWRSCTHSWQRLKMRYESLRNVAMHFKAFKCVKNAFYFSAVVTRTSRVPIFQGVEM